MNPARVAAANALHYERRRPEHTVLYQLVQERLDTFLAQVEAQTGTALPRFVRGEFDAFLECGILAHGFLLLRCADSAADPWISGSLPCTVGKSQATRTPARPSQVHASSPDHLAPLLDVGAEVG